MAIALLDAVEAGDLDAARIAHEAIGRLLQEPVHDGDAATK